MSRNIVYKYRTVDSGLDKITNVTPIKENNQADIAYLLAPFGEDTVKIKFLLNKYYELTNVNPMPAFNTVRITDQETIDAIVPDGYGETGWYLYYFPIGAGVSGSLKSNRATQYQVSYQQLDVDISDEDYIGNYATASTVDATISTELDVAFPSAVAGEYVNVYKTTSNLYSSWLLVLTTWVDQDELTNETIILNTLVYNETFKATTLSNDDFNIGTPEEQALVFNQIYAELAEIQATLAALTGSVAGFMLEEDYDTEGTAEDSVRQARRLGTFAANITYAEQVAKNALINQSVIVGSDPVFGDLTADKVIWGTGIETYYDGTNLIDVYGDGITRERGKNLFTGIKARAAITNGDVIQYDGAVGVSGVIWAKIADKTEINVNPRLLLGVATTDFTINETKDINIFGAINGLDTTGYDGNSGTSADEGQIIYYDSVNGLGGITLTKPVAPNVQIPLGIISIYHASTGQIKIKPELGLFLGDLHDVYFNGHTFDGSEIMKYDFANLRWTWVKGDTVYMSRDIQNGAFKETFDLLYSAGVMVLTNADGVTDSLTMQFSDGDTALDTTSLSLAPTFGSTTVPVHNHFYIPLSTKVLTVASNWPSEEHIKVAEVTVLDLTYTNTEGPIGNQNHNNHEKGTYDIGKLQHFAERLRFIGAKWDSGVAGATGGEWVKDTAGTLDFTSTAGVVWQLHPQTYMAQDTSSSGDIHIVNDFTAPYKAVASFDLITTFSDGSAIGNTYFNVFVYGVINKSGEYTPVMVNTPTEGYNNLTDAQTDLNATLVTTVPVALRNIAFPIARLLLRKIGATYSFIQSYDLREEKFGIGGTTGTGILDGEFIDDTFELQNIVDNSKVMKFSAGNQTTGTTRTVTMADADIDLAELENATNNKVVAFSTPTDIEYPSAKLVDDTFVKKTLPYTPITEADLDGTETMYIVDGTFNRITTQDLKDWFIVTSGVFDNTSDYGSTGLGSHTAQVLKIWNAALDSGGQFKFNTGNNIITDQFIYVQFPTITSNTNNLELSTDNGVTYYDVLVNGGNVYADVLSGKLVRLPFDGTNFNLDLDSLSQELTHDSIINSTYGVVNPINGIPSLNEVNGLLLNQVTINGDGEDGTTTGVFDDWTFVNFGNTTESISTGIFGTNAQRFTATGASAGGAITQAISMVSGSNYLVSVWVNPSLTAGSVGFRIYAGATEKVRYQPIDNTSSNVWQRISYVYTADGTEDLIRFQTATVNSGDIADFDGMMIVPLTNTPLASKTATQLNAIIPTYFEGVDYIKDFTLQSEGENGFDVSQYTSVTHALLNNVKPSTEYTWSESVEYKLYDSGQNLISTATASTVTTTANTAYISFDNTIASASTFMLVEGATLPSSFTAYNSPTTPFKITADLLSVGTVRDIAYPLNGNWWKDQYVDIALAVAIGDVIDTTAIPTIKETTGLFYAVDTVNNESQYGVYGDTLTLTGTATVYFELATIVTTEIEYDGSLIQESNTTFIQGNSNFATEYDITFNLDVSAQVGTNSKRITQLQEEHDDLEVVVATLTSNVAQYTTLFSTITVVSDATTAPAANITLLQSALAFDELDIYIESTLTNVTAQKFTVQFYKVPSGSGDSVQIAIAGTNTNTTDYQMTSFRLAISGTTPTDLTAYFARFITITTTGVTNVAATGMYIKKVVGVNY